MEVNRERALLRQKGQQVNTSSRQHHQQHHPQHVTTRELTQSFGWTNDEAFVQHDIHECASMLLERIDSAVTATTTTGTAEQEQQDQQHTKKKEHADSNDVHKLFVMKLNNYFRTLDIEYRSDRIEESRYLSLPVRGNSTIYQSLDSFFAEELLDGSAKLCVERNGKKSYHPAKKGVLMKKAPPVILMCLMRSDFDPQTGEPAKVVSRNEYYRTLDLKKYMTDDCTDESKYGLQAVVAHSGADAGYGHYFAFARVHVDREICEARDDLRHYLHERDEDDVDVDHDRRPRCWVKLNDEIVSLASDYEVFGNNFGGTKRNYWGGVETVTTNAVLLVYVRDGDRSSVLFDPARTPNFLSQQLRHEFEMQEEQAAQKLAEQTDSRTHAALYAVGVDDGVIPGSTKAVADKLLFGCPWQAPTDLGPSGVVKSVGSFNKQLILCQSLQKKIRGTLSSSSSHHDHDDKKQRDDDHHDSEDDRDVFLVAYEPSVTTANYYCGPTKILSEECAVGNIASSLIFVIQQPRMLLCDTGTVFNSSSSASSPTTTEITTAPQVTFHRFYDPFREVVVPIAAFVSSITVVTTKSDKKKEDGDDSSASSKNPPGESGRERDSSMPPPPPLPESTRPRDLLPHVLKCVKHRLAKLRSGVSSTDDKTQRDGAINELEFVEFVLQDLVDSASRPTTNLDDALCSPVSREESPNNASSFHDTAPVTPGATYIWQPRLACQVPAKYLPREQEGEGEGQANDADGGGAANNTNENNKGDENKEDAPQQHDQHHHHHQDEALPLLPVATKTAAQTRFPTAMAWSTYHRTKCTIKLVNADFRKGFSTTATLQAAGTTDFDDFIQQAAKALKLKPEQVPYLRIGKNASMTENPECPPTSIAWLRKAQWGSLQLLIRHGSKNRTGYIFYDILTCCTREEAETKPVLTFEFFDGLRVKPISRHQVVLPGPYGSFTYADLLNACKQEVLSKHQRKEATDSSSSGAGGGGGGEDAAQKRSTSTTTNNASSSTTSEELASILRTLAKDDVKLHLLDIWNGRIYNTYSNSDGGGGDMCNATVKSLEQNADYRLEIQQPSSSSSSSSSPPAPADASSSSAPRTPTTPSTSSAAQFPQQITVVHFSIRAAPPGEKNPTQTVLHGDPFFHTLEPGETLPRFRTRIAERLQLPIERIERWIARFVGAGGLSPVLIDGGSDDERGAKPIASQLAAVREKATRKNDIWLGLEHAPIAGARGQMSRRVEERAFAIA